MGKLSAITGEKLCLVTFYGFIKIVTIFVDNSQIIACLGTVWIEMESKFIKHNRLQMQMKHYSQQSPTVLSENSNNSFLLQ